MQASYGIENNFSPAAIGNLAQYPKPYFSDSKTLIFLLRAICGSSCSFIFPFLIKLDTHDSKMTICFLTFFFQKFIVKAKC